MKYGEFLSLGLRLFSRKSLGLAALVLCALGSSPALSAQDRGLQAIARGVVGRQDFDIGKQYAVIIGIDKYQFWNPLKSAVKEAKQVKEVLNRRYYVDEFLERYDEQASAASIRKLLTEELPKKLGKNDSVLIFYAGHGYLDEASQVSYWIGVDGVVDRFETTGKISHHEVRNMLRGLVAQRVLVLNDSCFSGDMLNTSRGNMPTINDAYFQKALQRVSRQVLTSGASETVPDQSEFGAQLLTLLERNNDTILDTQAMYFRLREGVKTTLPLNGDIPGHQDGGTFALFLKPQFGVIRVSARSDAQILLNGSKAGEVKAGAEAVLPKVATGTHTLSLVYADKTEERQVLLAPDQDLSVSFSYRPVLPGKLVVKAAGSGEVFLDGKAVGSIAGGGTLVLPGLSAGEHLVSIRYPDNQEDRKVNVFEGTETPVSFAYVPDLRGTVVFQGFPEGALVLSGGRELGVVQNGRFEARNLSQGPRTFQVSHDSWPEALSLQATINAAAPVSLNFAGAAIRFAAVPEGVSVAINGVTVFRAAVAQSALRLGPYPEGSYTVTLSGSDWETYRAVVQIRPGVDSDVAPHLVARRSVEPQGSGTDLPRMQTGLLVLDQRNNSDSLAVQARLMSPAGNLVLTRARNGELDLKARAAALAKGEAGVFKPGEGARAAAGAEEVGFPLKELGNPGNFAGETVYLAAGQNSLAPGTWVVSARKAGDLEDVFSRVVTLGAGELKSLVLPEIGYSLTYRITEVKFKIDQESIRRDRAGNDLKNYESSRATLSTLSGIFLGTAVAAVGTGIGAFILGNQAYEDYKAASDFETIRSKKFDISYASNTVILSAVGTTVFGLLSLIGLPDDGREAGKYRSVIKNSELELERLKAELSGLESQL